MISITLFNPISNTLFPQANSPHFCSRPKFPPFLTFLPPSQIPSAMQVCNNTLFSQTSEWQKTQSNCNVFIISSLWVPELSSRANLKVLNLQPVEFPNSKYKPRAKRKVVLNKVLSWACTMSPTSVVQGSLEYFCISVFHLVQCTNELFASNNQTN